MNDKPEINQKNGPAPALGAAADWSHLQHVKTLIGLSRARLDSDEVLRLIERREIEWAWDISRKNARRRELRIWRESLLAYLARENRAAGPLRRKLTLKQVIEAILPRPASLSARAAVVAASELQRRFLCCRKHLVALIADGELSCLGTVRRGQSPVVLYQSAFEFLQRRSISI